MKTETLEIHVINLLRSKDRREAMKKKLETLNLEYRLFEAIDGLSDGFEKKNRYNKSLGTLLYGAPLTSGEIACFASHYMLWEHCIRKQKNILILEDDIEISKDFYNSLSDIEKYLEKYGYLRLAATFQKPFKRIAKTEFFELVRFLKGPRGAQAYALTPEAAKKLIEHAKVWKQPVDDYIDASHIHGIPCIGCIPGLVSGDYEDSTIGNRKRVVPWYRKIIRELYRLYEQIAFSLFNIKMNLSEK